MTDQGLTDHDEYKYEVRGIGTHLKEPILLDPLDWFQRLLIINPNLSHGFQSIKEAAIVAALSSTFSAAKRAQFGAE